MNRLRHVAESEYAISGHEAQLIDLITKFDSRQEINAYFSSLHQKRDEFIEQYHVRVIHFFVSIDDVNRQLDTTLSELNEKYHFQKMIETFLVNLKNKQLSEQLLFIYQNENSHTFNLTEFCVIASVKYAFIQHDRKFQKKKNRKRHLLQQQLQKFVDRDSVQILKFYEFQTVSKNLSCNLVKICRAVNITNILFLAKFIVSESTCLQKSSFEVCFVDKSLSILKQMSCDLSEINTVVMNNCDIETIDEIFVFEFGK